MDERTKNLQEALAKLMRELANAPYDPREAFAAWPECVKALEGVGDRTFSEE